MVSFRLFFFVWLLSFSTPAIYARIVPANGAVLNFTQVLFEYDEVKDAAHYVITINTSEGPVVIKNSSLAFIQNEKLHFGQQYTWSYTAYKNGKPIFKSPVYYFEIKAAFQTSEAWMRSSIEINDTTGYKDGIIFLDYMGMAINRSGKPVWYMPLERDSLQNLKMRNIKMTPAGTITYLDNIDCFEKDIDANVIWKAPNDGTISGDKQEYYHHDFFKMDDGTYIAAGYRFSNEPNFYDNSVMCRVRYNTLIQYNSEGNVVWYWDESKHADRKSLYGDSGPTATEVSGTHMNGVAYYKPEDAFICSFRDNSAVLKISHQTGEVLYNLGDSLKKYYPDEVPFSSQHGPSLLSDGSIVVYNNNISKEEKRGSLVYPIVRIFSQPSPGVQSKMVWEYECMSSAYPDGIFGKEGYASQLPYNDNLLVCMGGANFIFEITKDKKIVWQCTLQQFDEGSSSWVAVNNYRCSYASSLYPCYFTLQQLRVSPDGTMFRINNEGTEDDQYTIEVNGKITGSSIVISAGKNKEVFLPDIDIKQVNKSGTTVKVWSAKNKNFVREISFDD